MIIEVHRVIYVVVGEVVVAQLVERLLLISEVRGSTPVGGKIYIEHLFVYYQLY